MPMIVNWRLKPLDRAVREMPLICLQCDCSYLARLLESRRAHGSTPTCRVRLMWTETHSPHDIPLNPLQGHSPKGLGKLHP